jgi:hypothetical protein
MNTLEILKCLRSNENIRKHTIGVYPSNKLPNKFKKPAAFVINIDASHLSGSHWIAMYFPKSGKAEYFDSYAIKPFYKHFIRFLKRNAASYIHNPKRLQGNYSKCCGHYCCMYLLYRCNKKSLRQFLNIFKVNNFNYNDELVEKLHRSAFSRLTNQNTRVGRVCIQNCGPLRYKKNRNY